MKSSHLLHASFSDCRRLQRKPLSWRLQGWRLSVAHDEPVRCGVGKHPHAFHNYRSASAGSVSIAHQPLRQTRLQIGYFFFVRIHGARCPPPPTAMSPSELSQFILVGSFLFKSEALDVLVRNLLNAKALSLIQPSTTVASISRHTLGKPTSELPRITAFTSESPSRDAKRRA